MYLDTLGSGRYCNKEKTSINLSARVQLIRLSRDIIVQVSESNGQYVKDATDEIVV